MKSNEYTPDMFHQTNPPTELKSVVLGRLNSRKGKPLPEKTPEEKRDAGVKLSSDNSGEIWKEYAIGFIKDYLKNHHNLFCDDLWSAGLAIPSSPRGLGAVIKHASREGWIQEQTTNGCILARPSVRSNLALSRVWKSNLYVS